MLAIPADQVNDPIATVVAYFAGRRRLRRALA